MASDGQATWQRLEQGIDQVVKHLEDGLSYQRYMELYTDVYNYCTQNRTQHAPSALANTRGANLMGQFLYEQLQAYLKRHLEAVCADARSHSDDALELFYVRQWARFTTAATYIHHIFRYLNRHWVRRELDEGHRGVYDVYTLCLVIWRDHLFMAIHDALMQATLGIVERHRNGESIDTSLIKNVSSSFTMLGLDETDTSRKTLDVYKKYFEEPFIQATVLYYRAESEKFLAENSVTDYMKKAEQRLREEEARIELYLDPSSSKPLMNACVSTLVHHHEQILVDEFKNLLMHDKIEDLGRCYGLLARIPNGLEPLKVQFQEHIKQAGLASVEKLAQENQQDVDPKSYVESLLSVQKKYYQVVVQAFNNDAGFIGSCDKACRDFVNKNAVCPNSSSKSPELLARYCDSLLKRGAKNYEETEIDQLLTDVMTVFQYTIDRDVFQRFYTRGLSRRLVHDASASEDAEANMISKLKETCGYEFTSKMTRLFTDISVSKDLNEKFQEHLSQAPDFREIKGVDFYVKVFATVSWMLTSPNVPFNIPVELEKVYDRFQKFYQTQHSGRKLNWIFAYSTGELKTNYVKAGKVSYTFQLYTYTMAVLLQYNNQTSYTADELVSLTGMDKDTVLGQLQILTKNKVLTHQNDTYALNFGFKSKKVRVNLRAQVKSEQKQESDDTHKTIEDDRKIVIQAAIVRIMKTRKVFKHVQLVQEVIAQLANRFSPKVTDIKKSIDILLEKEFIERVEGQKDTYSYLA